MKSTSLSVLLSAVILLSGEAGRANEGSLDLRFQDLSKYGGLTNFCYANPAVVECKIGIGEWKPQELERIKASSIQCFDSCPADTYGFVKSTDGKREYPEINTKDFNGSSPSKGVEFRLYPLSVEILRYEGCAGCSLIKETPREVYLKYQGATVSLPMLGYGIFYVPTSARKLILRGAEVRQSIGVSLVFAKNSEERTISKASVVEYARMLNELKYSEIN
jgi:hypothetical protein